MDSRKTSLVAVIALFLGLFWAMSAANSNKCINVYVDFGKLDNGSKISKCISSKSNTNALDLLKSSNLIIEGTQKYGSSIVCRVNNFPAPAVEPCLTMPPEKAYWAVLVKKKMSSITYGLDPTFKWKWADTGISEVYLNPGDSLGLVFASDGKVKFPK